jgi:hypothetical protein
MRFDQFQKIIQHKKDCANRGADYSKWKSAQANCLIQLKEICHE